MASVYLLRTTRDLWYSYLSPAPGRQSHPTLTIGPPPIDPRVAGEGRSAHPRVSSSALHQRQAAQPELPSGATPGGSLTASETGDASITVASAPTASLVLDVGCGLWSEARRSRSAGPISDSRLGRNPSTTERGGRAVRTRRWYPSRDRRDLASARMGVPYRSHLCGGPGISAVATPKRVPPRSHVRTQKRRPLANQLFGGGTQGKANLQLPGLCLGTPSPTGVFEHPPYTDHS